MDWSLVTGAVVFVGGLLVKTAQETWQRHLAAKDKERDRLIALEDKERERQAVLEAAHDRELRDAYAEFISAVARYFSMLSSLVAHCKERLRLKEEASDKAAFLGADSRQAEEIYEETESTELNTKLRALEEACSAAAIDADRRATVALLLEHESSYYDRLHRVSNVALRLPDGSSKEELERFLAETGTARDELDLLTRVLAGRFAPSRLRSRPSLSAAQALPSNDAKALNPGDSGSVAS